MARLPEARNPSFVGFSQDMFLEASPELIVPQTSTHPTETILIIRVACYLCLLAKKIFISTMSRGCVCHLGTRNTGETHSDTCRCASWQGVTS